MKSTAENSKRSPLADSDYLKPVAFAFIVLFGFAIWVMTRGWDKPLLDLHAFRQTQTAISVTYMTENPRMFLDYITPVLGKPWQIPMEFPLFQWMTARWSNVNGMPIDQSGRIVSLIFWFACLWPIWSLLGSAGLGRTPRILAMSVVYACPLYLYWARAFMIETLALFLALAMVALAWEGCRERSLWRVGLAFLAGCMGALVKVTTWSLACGAGGLLLLFWMAQDWRARWKWTLAAGLALTLPILPAKVWLAHTESIKEQNPFARELLLSSAPGQQAWYFGTLEQKLSLKTWEVVWRHVTDQLLVPVPGIGAFFLLLVLIAGAIASPKRIPLILIFLAGFVSGPVIFTNLYFEHSYYWSANGIWLLLAVGTALAGIWECRPGKIWPRIVALALTLVITVSGFVTWSLRFLPILQSLPTAEQLDQAWRKPVQQMVPPGRTILILGHDWNPTALYYARRKGIAFPLGPRIPFPGAQLTESLDKLAVDERLGAVVVNEAMLAQGSQAFWAEQFSKLGISASGMKTAFGILFPANDLVMESR